MARVFPGPQAQIKRPNPASNLIYHISGAMHMNSASHLFATNPASLDPSLSSRESASDRHMCLCPVQANNLHRLSSSTCQLPPRMEPHG